MKDKAHENIKLLKSFYDAVSHGELDRARNILDPDVEWIEPNVPGLWFAGVHRGVEAVLKEVIGPTAEKIEKFRAKMKKFYAVGDHVVVIGTFCGRGKSTGAALDAVLAHVWTLRNGKAVRFEAFHDPASWREALGLGQAEKQRLAA